MVRDAARSAGDLGSRVGRAIGFDEILHSGSSHAAAEPIADRTARLIDSIRERLARLGFTVHQPLGIRVESDGRMRVELSPPAAAEIESALNADPQLVEQAQQWHRASGSRGTATRLTV
jgi:hypothetical protein